MEAAILCTSVLLAFVSDGAAVPGTPYILR
jgi:hypothetical protein